MLISLVGQEEFDPRRRQFSEEELRPQPMIKKSRKVSTNFDLMFTTGQKKTIIHQLTTMLSTSTNVLFPGPANHQRWWPFTLIIDWWW